MPTQFVKSLPLATATAWWQQLITALTPSYELAPERIIEVAALRGQAVQLFVSELGKVLQEFPQVHNAQVCNVRTSQHDWQLLLLLDLKPERLKRRRLRLLHRRLQGLLAINLLCRPHCPQPLLGTIEHVAQPVQF